MNDNISNYYVDFLSEIKEKIRQSQYEAAKAVNTIIINLYWEIGNQLSEKLKNGWGKAIVENIADDIQKEFPGIIGFSVRNIRYMVQFYDEYAGNEILQPLVAEISWSKPIGIATYTITPTLPYNYRKQLPSGEELAKRLETFMQFSKLEINE